MVSYPNRRMMATGLSNVDSGDKLDVSMVRKSNTLT